MKKLRLFMPLVAMLLMSAGFVGCKGTNEPDDPTLVDPTAGLTAAQMYQNVIGTYNGKLVEKTYFTNSTETNDFTAYFKLSIDSKSNNYLVFTDAAYNYTTWTALDYPTGLFSISASNKIYTLKNINSSESFTVTSDGYLSITLIDNRNCKGLGLVQTFTGNK